MAIGCHFNDLARKEFCTASTECFLSAF